jgi:hypothetical protein
MPAQGRHIYGSDYYYLPLLASASHFFINELFAAPASGLPFLSMAFSAQPDPFAAPLLAPASHFFMNDDFAAPERGLPSLLTALSAQSDAAAGAAGGVAAPATCEINKLTAIRPPRAQEINFAMLVIPLNNDLGEMPTLQ